MGRTMTKMADGKFKVEDVNEIVVERKTLEDALVNLKKQKASMEENLTAINEEIDRLEKVL